jgi:hypothetical protein
MDFETPEMENYFNSLPSDVQNYIENSGAAITTLGELMEIGEHFKHEV